MLRILAPFVLGFLLASSLWAQERGPVTNLPMPRYVSLKASKAHARRGPSLSHRIDWVFTRKNMPLEIYGAYENWRRVRDIDGAGGWVHYSMLSGVRSAIVTTDMQPLLSRPDRGSALRARIEHNVIVSIDECTLDWCRARSGQFKGWLPKNALWGVYPNELRD